MIQVEMLGKRKIRDVGVAKGFRRRVEIAQLGAVGRLALRPRSFMDRCHRRFGETFTLRYESGGRGSS